MVKSVFHSAKFRASAFAACLALFSACREKPEADRQGASTDLGIPARANGGPPSGSLPIPATVPQTGAQLPGLRIRIKAYCDSMLGLAKRYGRYATDIDGKDSLRKELEGDSALAFQDSVKAEWAALRDSASELVREYESQLASGSGFPGLRPVLLRSEKAEDPLILNQLPEIAASTFLLEHPFFFLGAGPFLHRQPEDDTGRDPRGNPELRFCTAMNRNTSLIMDMVRGFQGIPVETREGGPIPTYHDDPDFEQSINGTGSLIHIPGKELPVYFITEGGLAPARLAQVTDRLFPSREICALDLPEVCFAANAVPKGEILGVLVLYGPIAPTHCKVTRNGQLWTVDLTGDGVPEIAGVGTSYEGAADTINKVLWFGNASGTWQLIDSAEDQDCT
jgi:hypothetical protein